MRVCTLARDYVAAAAAAAIEMGCPAALRHEETVTKEAATDVVTRATAPCHSQQAAARQVSVLQLTEQNGDRDGPGTPSSPGLSQCRGGS